MNLDTELLGKLTEQYNIIVQTFEGLFYVTESGEKQVRPDVTIEQVRKINEKLSYIQDNYKKIIEEYLRFKKLEKATNKESFLVGDEIRKLARKYDIDIPDFFKKIYGLN